MTLDDAGELIARCIVIWPHHPLPTNPDAMDAYKALWVTTLADLPLAAIQAAVTWWIAEEEWFPKPGNIRERADHLLPGGIVRHDSYAFQAGLDRAVRLALESGDDLMTHREGTGHVERGTNVRQVISDRSAASRYSKSIERGVS